MNTRGAIREWERIERNRELVRFAARIVILLAVIVFLGTVEGLTS